MTTKVTVDYDYIKCMMYKKNIKCGDLAEKTDMTLSDMYNMFASRTSPKLLTRLYNICEALDIELTDILKVGDDTNA